MAVRTVSSDTATNELRPVIRVITSAMEYKTSPIDIAVDRVGSVTSLPAPWLLLSGVSGMDTTADDMRVFSTNSADGVTIDGGAILNPPVIPTGQPLVSATVSLTGVKVEVEVLVRLKFIGQTAAWVREAVDDDDDENGISSTNPCWGVNFFLFF